MPTGGRVRNHKHRPLELFKSSCVVKVKKVESSRRTASVGGRTQRRKKEIRTKERKKQTNKGRKKEKLQKQRN
jgi:hypothetical protein